MTFMAIRAARRQTLTAGRESASPGGVRRFQALDRVSQVTGSRTPWQASQGAGSILVLPFLSLQKWT